MSKLISRTISENRYDVMCLNIETAEATTETFSLGSLTFNTIEKTLAELKKKFDTPTKKLVAITRKTSQDALYVMTEDCFIKNAIPVQDMAAARAYFKEHPDQNTNG